MQTIYYETSNFIRHKGNVVSLDAYRQKLAAVSGENWAEPCAEVEEPYLAPVTELYVVEAPRPRRTSHKGSAAGRLPVLLDLAATCTVVAFTVTALCKFLALA